MLYSSRHKASSRRENGKEMSDSEKTRLFVHARRQSKLVAVVEKVSTYTVYGWAMHGCSTSTDKFSKLVFARKTLLWVQMLFHISPKEESSIRRDYTATLEVGTGHARADRKII
jgi:hypothetical protein